MLRIYERMSNGGEDLHEQKPELKAFAEGKESKRYADKFTGMPTRPGLTRLMADVAPGDVLVVWRLDRLGMRAAELLGLLDELQARCAAFVSLRERIDSAAAVALVRSALASLAMADGEIRSEKTSAAIASKRARGEEWAGRPKGSNHKLTAEVLEKLKRLRDAEEPIAEMGRRLALSRPTIYAGLKLLDREA